MVPFFVQIKCQLGKSYEVANRLADAEVASEIYSTAGEFDLLVKVYVDTGIDIGHFVNEKIQVIPGIQDTRDRKSTRLNSSHSQISYAVFCLKKKKKHIKDLDTLAATNSPARHCRPGLQARTGAGGAGSRTAVPVTSSLRHCVAAGDIGRLYW